MGTFQIKCPSCNQTLRVNNVRESMKLRCPKCKSCFKIKNAQSSLGPDLEIVADEAWEKTEQLCPVNKEEADDVWEKTEQLYPVNDEKKGDIKFIKSIIWKSIKYIILIVKEPFRFCSSAIPIPICIPMVILFFIFMYILGGITKPICPIIPVTEVETIKEFMSTTYHLEYSSSWAFPVFLIYYVITTVALYLLLYSKKFSIFGGTYFLALTEHLMLCFPFRNEMSVSLLFFEQYICKLPTALYISLNLAFFLSFFSIGTLIVFSKNKKEILLRAINSILSNIALCIISICVVLYSAYRMDSK